MSSDQLQLWLSKLSQFESELERLHIALSVPHLDAEKYEFMKKLVDHDVPDAISKIQAKIEELQPPKPPSEAPPRARGRRPHRSFCESNESKQVELEQHDSQQDFNSEPALHALVGMRSEQTYKRTSSVSELDEYEGEAKPPMIDMPKDMTTGPSLGLARSRSHSRYSRCSTVASHVGSTNSNTVSSHTELMKLEEQTQGPGNAEDSSRDHEVQNGSKILVTKLDLRDNSSKGNGNLTKTRVQTEEGRVREYSDSKEQYQEQSSTRSFRKASGDGRIQLSYLAALTQHELYQ